MSLSIQALIVRRFKPSEDFGAVENQGVLSPWFRVSLTAGE